MSWAHILAARGIAPDSSAQQVLTELAAYATEAGKAWPSQKTIARNTKLSRSTVQLALGRLKAKALISVIEPASLDGSPAIYLLALPSLSAGLASQPVQPDLARQPGTPCQNDNQPSPIVAFASPAVGPESSGRNLRETPERAGAREAAPPRPAQAEIDPETLAMLRRMREQFKTPEAPGTKIAPPVASGNGLAKHIPTEAERLLEIERRRTQAGLLANAADASGTRKG